MKAMPIILSVLALAVVGAIAVDRLGGTDPSSADSVALELQGWSEEGLHPGSSGGASVSATKARKPKVIYWNTKYYKLGPQELAGFWMQCPKGYMAIDGYFYADRPGVVLGSSFAANGAKVNASRKPRWNFGVVNFSTTETARYYTGVTCMNGVRGR